MFFHRSKGGHQQTQIPSPLPLVFQQQSLDTDGDDDYGCDAGGGDDDDDGVDLGLVDAVADCVDGHGDETERNRAHKQDRPAAQSDHSAQNLHQRYERLAVGLIVPTGRNELNEELQSLELNLHHQLQQHQERHSHR